jgi:cell division protein ZapA
MAQVTIEINGRPYVVGCEDGQEANLRDLAALFDVQVRQVAAEVGSLGETRLFLMGALLMADELADAKAKLTRANAELNRIRSTTTDAEARAIAALDAAARRIEVLAEKAAS